MSIILPPERPKIKIADLLSRLKTEIPKIDLKKIPILVVGIRGYYKNMMGVYNANDRSIYDDAIVLITPYNYKTFNGNTDPSAFKAGFGTGINKGMASLVKGYWNVYKLGLHKGKYLALCQQAGEVTVSRDGLKAPYVDKGYFGINIHKGGLTSTSSEGCQTIPPGQWGEFINTLDFDAKKFYGINWRKKIYPYILLEE